MMDLAGFTSSTQGQQALQQLQAQGFAGPQAQAMLGAAVPAATQAMRSIARGDKTLPKFSQSNYIMNFTAGAVSGLIRGEGFMGSAVDGMQGMVGGYIAQVIAAQFGLPKRTAGVIGAVITPMAIDFIWSRLEGVGEPQQPPAQHPRQLSSAQHGYVRPCGYGYATQAQYVGQGHAVPQYQPGQGYCTQQRYQQAYGATGQVPHGPSGAAPQVPAYTPGQGYRR